MKEDTREDIIKVALKMHDYVSPLIDPIEKYAKESTKITQE
ncbi:hypothetical protein [Veillonella sp. CHU740]|nr:hypothetical protein [Veillonella sp. CHU740]